MEKETLTSGEEQRMCFNCSHFQMKQWDIGYCRLHQVNVLKTYSCSKFVLQKKTVDTIEQGIDTQDAPESQVDAHNSEEPLKGGEAL